MGLAPQKPRLAGVKLVFLGFFVLTNPSVWIVHCCTMVAEVPYGMHTRKRSHTAIQPYSHHLPQGGPYIALTIFGPNVRLNNIARTLL